jgi:hypothetical protein
MLTFTEVARPASIFKMSGAEAGEGAAVAAAAVSSAGFGAESLALLAVEVGAGVTLFGVDAESAAGCDVEEPSGAAVDADDASGTAAAAGGAGWVAYW